MEVWPHRSLPWRAESKRTPTREDDPSQGSASIGVAMSFVTPLDRPQLRETSARTTREPDLANGIDLAPPFRRSFLALLQNWILRVTMSSSRYLPERGLELEVRLNQVAGGWTPLQDLVSQFHEWSESEQRLVLEALGYMMGQAGAVDADGPSAVARSGVRATRTSAVLLAKGPVLGRFAQIRSLPKTELEDGLKLGIALFSIADERRRSTRCAVGCTHWWHGDLSDAADVIRRVRSDDLRGRRG